MPKYKIDQKIYYIHNNKIHSAPVLSRMSVENKHEADTPEQMDLFTPFGASGVMYATCHGIFLEKYVFSSKKDLIDSL